MSERAPQNIEHGESLLPAGEVEKLLEATTERSPAELQAEQASQQDQLEKARAVAETAEQDDPLARMEASETEAAKQTPVAPPNSSLKKLTLQRELQDIQRKESAPVRALSKFIHQPVIRAASEVAGKSVSRPSGLLGGGIAAFLGTSIYLYLAYHIGFTYEPSVFVFLLVVGFVAGVTVEMLARLVLKPKNQ